MRQTTGGCFVFGLPMFAVLLSGFLCLGKEDPDSPELLVAQARKLQDVWSDGTPALKVRTEIEVLDASGKTTPVQYVVTWISPSRWREELELANYKWLRVHNSKGYWQQSTLSFQPEIIFQLDSILDFKTVLRIGAKQVLGKVKRRNKDGVRQKCTDVKWTTGTERTLCFDEATGNLLSVEYPRSESQIASDISRVEYSEFNNVGQKRVPFGVRAFRGRTVVVTAKVLEPTPITEETPELFLTPTNSEFWQSCDDMREPELVGRVPPIYPPSARSNGEQGRVMFYAVIEADGTVSHLAVIRRAAPTLESAAAEAIRQWQYKPAACGSTPIRVQTSIFVDFWLRY